MPHLLAGALSSSVVVAKSSTVSSSRWDTPSPSSSRSASSCNHQHPTVILDRALAHWRALPQKGTQHKHVSCRPHLQHRSLHILLILVTAPRSVVSQGTQKIRQAVKISGSIRAFRGDERRDRT